MTKITNITKVTNFFKSIGKYFGKKQVKRSDLLIRAMFHLESNKFVCFAIDAAKWDFPVNSNAFAVAQELKQEIADRICEYGTVSKWLHETHGVSYEDMTEDRMLFYRYRWLRQMAVEAFNEENNNL